jgi:dUTP pyrophosphatase
LNNDSIESREHILFSAVIGKQDIVQRLKTRPPLIEGFIERERQIGSNGVDLTVKKIGGFVSKGAVAFFNQERVISNIRELQFEQDDWLFLRTGSYKITFNEVINMPTDLVAFARPRSSILRSGASIETAIWDAGYRGRSEALLNIFNTSGLKIKKNARAVQIVFLKLSNPTAEVYKGVFQDENID